MEALNVVISGIGGQGVVLASDILADAAIKNGLKVIGADTFGLSHRGGTVVSHLRIGRANGPLVPENKADILIGFEPVETLRCIEFLSKESLVLMNNHRVIPPLVNLGLFEYPEMEKILELLKKASEKIIEFDAFELATKAGHSLSVNIVMLGGASATDKLPVSGEQLKQTIKEIVPKGTEETNLKAFESGREKVRGLLK